MPDNVNALTNASQVSRPLAPRATGLWKEAYLYAQLREKHLLQKRADCTTIPVWFLAKHEKVCREQGVEFTEQPAEATSQSTKSAPMTPG